VLGDLRRHRLRLLLGRELLAGCERKHRGEEERRASEAGERRFHWNLYLTVTSSRALSSRFSTCGAKVVLRTSILYLPGSSLSDFIGGVTPRDLPFTKISPQGCTANTSVAGGSAGFADSAFAGSAGFVADFAGSVRALSGAAAGICAGVGAGARTCDSVRSSGFADSAGLGVSGACAGTVAGGCASAVGGVAAASCGVEGLFVATRTPSTITSAASAP